MSLHPSLRVDTAGAQQRSVLTRIERLKDLMKKELWKEDQSVTGLPKTKIVRVKAKKKVKEETAEGAGAAGAATAGKTDAKAGAKAAAPAGK
jgi:small basic protein (TIGR04137 family)